MVSAGIKVTQDPESPVPVEIMAQSIMEIGAAVKRITRSRLNRKALVILVSHASKQPQYIVERVFDSLESLEKTFLKPK